jgi:hypothetical protein
MVTDYRKPLPRPTVDTKEYWEGCKRHELLVQRCRDCGAYRFYPAGMCHRCQSVNSEWANVSGKGTIYSWIVVNRPVSPAWADEVPYIAVIVELDEDAGVRIPGNLVDCAPNDVKAGMPVEVVFEDVTSEVTLPKWRPVSCSE